MPTRTRPNKEQDKRPDKEPDTGLTKGKAGFDAYYRNIYQAQWNEICSALLQPKLPSHYIDVRGHNLHNVSDNTASHTPHYAAPYTAPYSIDKASYTASLYACTLLQSLQTSTPSVLDMCAAPGGKALALLHQCLARNCSVHMVLNEKSRNRFPRLKRNIQNFFHDVYNTGATGDSTDTNAATQNISIVYRNTDGSLFGKHHKDEFDMVLVDAPCSNTQHVLQDKKKLALWSPAHNKALAIQQTKLLCAAIDACNTLGFVVYMTCSIDPLENQHIIEKALKKRNVVAINIVPEHLRYASLESVGDNADPQSHGVLIIPTIDNNVGPLYICALQKQAVP